MVMTAPRNNVIYQGVGQDQMDLKDRKYSVNIRALWGGVGRTIL